MKRTILCEGKTDALILSLFLGAYGWEFRKGDPFKIKIDPSNQTLCWYVHPGRPTEDLMIWGVGGVGGFPSAIEAVVDRTRSEPHQENRFEKVALVFDKDDRDDAANLALVQQWLTNAEVQIAHLQIGNWNATSVELRGTKHNRHELSVLPITVPLEEPGDLEVFLRTSISDMSADDRLLVHSSTAFITGQPDNPYLAQRRLRSKACLGVILSVISPDWVFTTLDNKLRQVPWTGLETVQQAFAELRTI